MSSEKIVHADSGSLKQRIASNEIVMVDFWADWCAPCKAMAPILDRLADEYPSVLIVKVDAAAHEEVLEEYNVRSLPTLLLFRSGERVDQLVGKMPHALIKRAIESQVLPH